MKIALRKMYNASTKTGIALHKIGLAEPLISIALHGTDIANARMVIARTARTTYHQGKRYNRTLSGNYPGHKMDQIVN